MKPMRPHTCTGPHTGLATWQDDGQLIYLRKALGWLLRVYYT